MTIILYNSNVVVETNAELSELADEQDLGSCALGVWVQVPHSAGYRQDRMWDDGLGVVIVMEYEVEDRG